jgi:hypothetical protein
MLPTFELKKREAARETDLSPDILLKIRSDGQ